MSDDLEIVVVIERSAALDNRLKIAELDLTKESEEDLNLQKTRTTGLE